MKNQSWWLADAAELRRCHPYTFYKPSQAVIGKLEVGRHVKLIFEFDNPEPDGPSGERMWVRVTEIRGNRYRGVLDNAPAHLGALRLGDTVEFEERHIIDTEFEDTEPDIVEKYLPRCFVTRRVLYDGVKAGYLYREEPEEEHDSGWRIMAGDETDEYMDESANIFYVSLGAVLNEDDSFLSLLNASPGAAFTRDPQTGEFKADA